MDAWRQNEPLAARTTLEVGGAAEFFFAADSVDSLRDALLQAGGMPVTLLGGGSNVLVADRGIAGLVLHYTEDTITLDGNRIRVGAGARWDHLVQFCVDHDLAGIECLSGIPGHVGAAPIQNIGAYGRDVSEVIHAVEVIDRTTLELKTMNAEDCRFAYRSSAFKTVWRGRYIVTALQLHLKKGGTPTLRYEELAAAFDTHAPDIRQVRAAVLAIRRNKSMVWDPRDPNHRSAGSFFVNPVVSNDMASAIDTIAAATVPRFPTGDHQVKIPAAWLIERAGFRKGYTRGRVGISSAHALALINRGGATAAEMVSLATEIQQAVADRFRVDLQPEPVWLGF